MYKFIHICSYNYMIADSSVIAIDSTVIAMDSIMTAKESIFSTKNVNSIDEMLFLKTKNVYSYMMLVLNQKCQFYR